MKSLLLGRTASLLVSASLVGCSASPQSEYTIPQAEALTLYEGLPHPMYETEVLEAEKNAKPTVDLHGYPFYRATLSLKPDDERSVKEILSTAATYEPFGGEKKCGGFHPDFAFAWTISGKRQACLICFGCKEIKVFRSGNETRFDIADAPQTDTRPLSQQPPAA